MIVNRSFWKGVRAALWTVFLFAGGIFWIAANSGGFAMSEAVYGPDVIEIPAEIWAGMLFLPSVCYLTALYINGRRWWTPLVRLAAGFVVAVKFSAFVVSSSSAPFGDIVMIWGVVLGGATVVLACVDAIEASRQWGARGAV